MATSWKCAESIVSLETPVLVGILNATPDSFSDGGMYVSVEKAVAWALEMESQGATIIDVGGESTRPGATRVSAQEQMDRVLPIIEGVRGRSGVRISIDTTSAQVAQVALDAGATIINDVSAGTEDTAMFSTAGESGAGLVLMHRRLPPESDAYCDAYNVDPQSDDIVHEILTWFLERIEMAVRHGVQRDALAIDPGLGFGKSVAQNWQIVQEIHRFVEIGYPVFIGASRKRFIGATAGISEPAHRDEASAAVAKQMATDGAQIFRVHNVASHVRMLQSHSYKNAN
ncbi:MAG: dihydropteroate synthase [Phycisphaerales bacterium]